MAAFIVTVKQNYKNDPGLCQLTEKAQSHLKATQIDFQSSNADDIAIKEEGRSAANTVTKYDDWLFSTDNPSPPDSEIWVKPSIHPCQCSMDTITSFENLDIDYVNILNSVQPHTRCSTGYCLRKTTNENELHCRFGFPFETCSAKQLHFEKVNTSCKSIKYKSKLITQRNYPSLNTNERL